MPETPPPSLFIRLTAKQKQTLIQAAEQSALSLSGFVLEAALARASALEEGRSPSAHAFDWKEALDLACSPGGQGYKWLGRALGRALSGLLRKRLSRKAADSVLAKLQTAFSRGHENQAWALLEGALKAELATIPSRKRKVLLAGLSEAFDRDELV